MPVVLSDAIGHQYDGRYLGTNNIVASEIRIDTSLNVISEDLYFLYRDRETGSTQFEYMYSFISVNLEVNQQNNTVKIICKIEFFRYTTFEGVIALVHDVRNDNSIQSDPKTSSYL